MPQQSQSQVRVIDPILTEVARGYTSQKAAVADALFPVVSVNTRAGRILKFLGLQDQVTPGQLAAAVVRTEESR